MGDRSAWAREGRAWLLALVLASPAAIPYACHYAGRPDGGTATGFLLYDMAYYSANGREHWDDGGFSPTYGNPSDPSYDTPRIYAQPMSLLLGAAHRVTGLDPGTIWVAFGAIAAVACARAALALYRHLFGLGDAARWCGLVAFFWGGGVLALAGALHAVWARPPGLWMPGSGSILNPFLVFRFDPFDGWWFLNFGRNLVFPNEALYHAIFLLAILSTLRGRYGLAVGLAALMAASHPFTGIELLAILGAWSLLEIGFVGGRSIPRWFAIACAGLAACHLGYYLGYLNRFAGHRALAGQWTLDWGVDAVHFVPAYLLVGGFAAWTFRTLPRARLVFAETRNRLFLVWFLVVFAMSNHEFAIRPPVQPIHFTRGYDWLPLFFLGAPAIIGMFRGLLKARPLPMRVGAVGLAMALLVGDNAAWLAYFPIRVAHRQYTPDVYLSADQRATMAGLGSLGEARGVVVCQDHLISYLSTVYTPLRSWVGHEFNTPDRAARQAEVDRFFATGAMPDAWASQTLLVVMPNVAAGRAERDAGFAARGGRVVVENPGYVAYRVPPAHDLARSAGPTTTR